MASFLLQLCVVLLRLVKRLAQPRKGLVAFLARLVRGFANGFLARLQIDLGLQRGRMLRALPANAHAAGERQRGQAKPGQRAQHSAAHGAAPEAGASGPLACRA